MVSEKEANGKGQKAGRRKLGSLTCGPPVETLGLPLAQTAVATSALLQRFLVSAPPSCHLF